MLSRVADGLYWMGRYLERAENVTRLLLVTEDLSTEIRGLHEELADAQWHDLLAVFPGSAAPRPHSVNSSLALSYLFAFLMDQYNPYSVAFSLRRARDNARSVREALTMEVFLNLNETYRDLEGQSSKNLRDLPSCRNVLWSTEKGLFSIVGAIEHTLTRDQGWLFLKLGESLERTLRAAFILRAKLPSLVARERKIDLELHYTRWRGLLRHVSSLENYRQPHGARLEPRDVIRFLLFDANTPRSLRHGTAAVKSYLERISDANELTLPTRIIGKLLSRLSYEADDVIDRADFRTFLDHLLSELGKTHDALASEYFATYPA